MERSPHVVIVGAGFAGVAALRALAKTPVRVTLIDKMDHHVFLPLLYQVATNQLREDAVGYPAHDLVDDRDDFGFRQAEVTAIDLETKSVTTSADECITYDYLVVAVGAVVNFFGVPGAIEHAFPLYTLEDSLRLRSHIWGRLDAARADPALIESGALRFCVVGGGATGVEVAGALAKMLQTEISKSYPDLPSEKEEVHLFEMGGRLLPPFQAGLQDYTKSALEERGVQVHLGERVVEVEPELVRLASGVSFPTHTLVWAAGLTVPGLARSLGAETVQGRVIPAPALSLPAHPEVFVIGDVAAIDDGESGETLAQLGSVAQQAGTQAGRNIARMVAGKQPEPFRYQDKGTMAIIGQGAAVVQLRSGRTMTGHAAWLAWHGVHLMLLAGRKQKKRAVIDWGKGIVGKGRDRAA